MTTYYRGRSALITHEVFEVRVPYRQRFAISELRDVHVERTGPDTRALGCLGLAAMMLVGTVVSSPVLSSPQQWLAAFVAVAAPSVLGGACWRINPPAYELRATYRGYQVQLFRSCDAQVFGQVKRALIRALEAYEAW
jgi:hypothetical protein